MTVVDASALIGALVGDRPPSDLVLRLAEADLHAPHVVDVEVLHALRRLERRNAITARRASQALDTLDTVKIRRYPHQQLRHRAWQLRANLSAYDAMYVSLAEELQMPLVTMDGRLARAPGNRARVELFAS